MFSDLVPNVRTSEITAFCVDDRHRKFYLGDASGYVKVFNASNGVFIKTIGEDDVVPPEPEEPTGDDKPAEAKEETKGSPEKAGTTRRRRGKGGHVSEISGLFFVNTDHLLITASHDSTLNVYDEENPEMTPKLRNLAGGHLSSEITYLEFSQHLSLIATGAASGTITIWDYEMSRIEGMCIFHTREILTLKFLDPYPALISSSFDGYICLWGVRGCDIQNRYSCICCLVNMQLMDMGQAALTVLSMLPFVGEQKAIPQSYSTELSEEDMKQRYVNCLKGNSTEGAGGRKARSSVPGASPTGGDQNAPKEKPLRFADAARLVNRDRESVKLRAYVVTGDEKGRVRLWDFTQVLAANEVHATKPYKEQKFYFNPKRKEDVDVAGQAEIIFRKYAVTAFDNPCSRANPVAGPLVVVEKCMIVKEWEAHKDQISCISKIEKPLGFITASLDKHVKVWSARGEEWGDIMIVGENPVRLWSFPYDWNEVREKDKADVIEVMKLIEPLVNPESQAILFDEPADTQVLLLFRD